MFQLRCRHALSAAIGFERQYPFSPAAAEATLLMSDTLSYCCWLTLDY